jgi:hypothetical protein
MTEKLEDKLGKKFNDNSADIVMALGSIQFISFKYIRKNYKVG